MGCSESGGIFPLCLIQDCSTETPKTDKWRQTCCHKPSNLNHLESFPFTHCSCPCRHHTYEILAQTLHFQWRVLGAVMRQSLQTRSWHVSQRSPRSKIRPKVFRQRAHCRSPNSWGRREPLCLISSSSFFSFLWDRNSRTSNILRKVSLQMNMSSNDEILTVSSSPLASLISHPSAAPSGSFLFHFPAERRGSDPPQSDPLVRQLDPPSYQLVRTSHQYEWRESDRTT